MLDGTVKKLESYFENEPQLGTDGHLHDMDRVTRITKAQCERLGELHFKLRPELSLEVGLAYGFSSLSFLDAMNRGKYGHHIALDPLQETMWHGIARASIDQLGFSDRFTFRQTRSDVALTSLIADGKRTQFMFFDGDHTLDGIITDLYLANQLLDVGGLLVVNDMWLPAVRCVASYVTENWRHFKEVPSVHENIFVVEKLSQDRRAWNDFHSFDAAGLEQSRGNFLHKMGLLRRSR